MKFNKCVRCGCFFASENDVCPNCKQKDDVDKLSLKTFLSNNDMPQNAESLAFKSGVSLKNVNRYLQQTEFSFLKKEFRQIQQLQQEQEQAQNNNKINL